jgi:hypothetical protein
MTLSVHGEVDSYFHVFLSSIGMEGRQVWPAFDGWSWRKWQSARRPYSGASDNKNRVQKFIPCGQDECVPDGVQESTEQNRNPNVYRQGLSLDWRIDPKKGSTAAFSAGNAEKQAPLPRP